MSPAKTKPSKRPINKRGPKDEPIPASLACWGFANWPCHIFPHRPEAARHLVDVHRESLLRAGALARIGKEVVVIGDRYAKWIRSQPWTDVPMPTTAKEEA